MTTAGPQHGRRERTRTPIWGWALPVFGLGLAIAIPLLVWYAASAIVESTDGTLEEAVTDPAAPGYESLVASTPSHLLLGTDDTGALSMVAVIALASNDAGGTVLLLPPETLTDSGRLLDIHAAGAGPAVRGAVATLLRADVDAATELDAAAWATFTDGVAPFMVELTDDLVRTAADGTTELVYPAGQVELLSDQVGEFTSWVNPGESRFNRMSRQDQFWRSWISALAAADDAAAIPGETDSGIGRMMRGLSSGLAIVREAPVSPATADESSAAFTIESAAFDAIVADMLPFPLPSAPGARARVRLLDGVGGLQVATRYSSALVGAGAQIVIVGNAIEFGVSETRVVYHDESFATTAQSFADALGGATLISEPITDAVLDITVIIGEDLRPS